MRSFRVGNQSLFMYVHPGSFALPGIYQSSIDIIQPNEEIN